MYNKLLRFFNKGCYFINLVSALCNGSVLSGRQRVIVMLWEPCLYCVLLQSTCSVQIERKREESMQRIYSIKCMLSYIHYHASHSHMLSEDCNL